VLFLIIASVLVYWLNNYGLCCYILFFFIVLFFFLIYMLFVTLLLLSYSLLFVFVCFFFFWPLIGFRIFQFALGVRVPQTVSFLVLFFLPGSRFVFFRCFLAKVGLFFFYSGMFGLYVFCP